MSKEISVILKRLNKTEGIKGSFVITPDGMPVASELDENQNEETLAAISSSIYLAINKSMDKLDLGEVTRYVLCTEFGRIFIIGLGQMILVVLAEKEIKIPRVNVEIFQAANAFRKSGRLET